MQVIGDFLKIIKLRLLKMEFYDEWQLHTEIDT